MIRTAALALAVAMLPSGIVTQQAAPAAPASAQPSAACQLATTLDELAKALDDAVSGPGNKDRTCLRALLLPDARLMPVSKKPDGAFSPRLLTVDDWINAVSKLGDKAFYEHQIKVQAESYGHFAHLWSTYEIRDTPDGKATVTGINSVQAVNDGTRWRVISILWEPDTTAGPVPKNYLP